MGSQAVRRPVRSRRRPAARSAVGGLVLGALLLLPGATSVAAPTPPPLAGLEKSLQAAEHQTFSVTYATHGAGPSQSITFEQRPPDLRFGTTHGYVLDLAGTAYFCSSALGHSVCVKSGAVGTSLFALAALFDPASVLRQLKALQAQTAATVAGVSYRASARTIAGQRSTCLAVTVRRVSYEYCVTDSKGILAYGGTPTRYVELTAYSPSPPASDFAP